MINKFSGNHFFLSNMYPCRISYEGLTYNSVEYAYQAAKTTDPEKRKRIRQATSSRIAKREGRSLVLRENWENIKLSIMTDLIRIKFTQHDLRRMLKRTWPHELVEGNWWGDTFWGVFEGAGENHLGKILMEVRKEIVGMVE